MIDSSYIDKFINIISSKEIDKDYVKDIMIAIVISDYMNGTNQKELDVDKLCASQDANWNKLKSFLGLPNSESHNTLLPDVQLMRILCDCLYVCLDGSKIEGVSITSPATRYVCNAEGISVKGSDYVDEEGCKVIFDKYFANEEGNELFDFIKKVLSKVRNLEDKIDITEGKFNELFEQLYLPKNYDSCGFDVHVELPNTLRGISEESLDSDLEFYELQCLMDGLLMLAFGDTSNIANKISFTYKLLKIRDYMSDITPVGIGGTMGYRSDVFKPTSLLVNSAITEIYNNLFTDKILLNKDSIGVVYIIILRLYGLEA